MAIYDGRYAERDIGFELTVRSTDDPPTIDQITNDLMNAAEGGNFSIETPRVLSTQDDLQTVSVGKSRGEKDIGQLMINPGPWELSLDLEWRGDSTMYSDLQNHITRREESTLALYGQQHIWNVWEPTDGGGESSVTLSSDETYMSCNVSMQWRDFAVAGWR